MAKVIFLHLVYLRGWTVYGADVCAFNPGVSFSADGQ